MSNRQFQLHLARVFLAQSRAFSRSEKAHIAAYGWTLFEWAQAARREASRLTDVVQGDLFA